MRRVMVSVAVLLATATFGGSVAHAEAPVSMPEVQACSARPELAPGATGADVRCLQYLLILLGYDVDYNGIYDTPTAAAVKWYQSKHPPLRADGVAGDQTLRSLGIHPDVATPGIPAATGSTTTSSSGASGSASTGTAGVQTEQAPVELPTNTYTCLADAEQAVGSQGKSVLCLQQRLAQLGLYSGKQNSVFDTALQRAVTEFQKSRPPLNVDGRAGPRTLAALGIWSGVSPKQSLPASSTTPGGSLPVAPVLTPQPQWNMTADGIPFFGTHQACSRADAISIATEFARDGADIATQYWAVYIASREGGCRFGAVNINPATKDDSHCTFQINVLSGTFEPHGELGRRGWTPDLIKSSMQACADAASDLWVFCGRGPWTPPYACAPPWQVNNNVPPSPQAPVTATTTITAATVPPTPAPSGPTTILVPYTTTTPPATTVAPASPETSITPTGTTAPADGAQGD